MRVCFTQPRKSSCPVSTHTALCDARHGNGSAFGPICRSLLSGSSPLLARCVSVNAQTIQVSAAMGRVDISHGHHSMEETLKSHKSVFLVLALVLFTSCGSSSKNNSPTSMSVQGNWTITANDPISGTSSVFQVTLVSSPCTVSSSVGSFAVQGPSCFVADNQTSQGSLSGSGSFLYPPQGVLVGVPSDPIPANTSVGVNVLFVEADLLGDLAVFSGTGTESNASLTGTWNCDTSLTFVCTGIGGSFSGNHK